MKYRTGQTINENIVSFDKLNNPITGVTFDIVFFKDNSVISGINYNLSLIDSQRAVYNLQWSASTLGDYQFYAKNNITEVIFMSDIYNVVDDDEASMTVYVGI